MALCAIFYFLALGADSCMPAWHWVAFAALARIARDFCACFSLAVPAGRHDVSLRAAARGRGATVVEERARSPMGAAAGRDGPAAPQLGRWLGRQGARRPWRAPGPAMAGTAPGRSIFASSLPPEPPRSAGLHDATDSGVTTRRSPARSHLFFASDSKQAQSLSLDARRDRADASI